jgi:hypothetical protein
MMPSEMINSKTARETTIPELSKIRIERNENKADKRMEINVTEMTHLWFLFFAFRGLPPVLFFDVSKGFFGADWFFMTSG